jgi:capsular polysaccharide biosynthesis protein
MTLAYRLKNKLKDHLRKPWKFFKRLPVDLELYGARAASRFFPGRFFIEPNRLHPPSRLCPSTVAWVAASGIQLGASVRQVDPACVVANPLPKTVHANVRQQFLIDRAYDYAGTFVAKIPQGRMWGHGFIITPDDQVLEDVSIDFRSLATHQSSVLLDWKLQPLKTIDGRVAVLATDGGALYYHWLLQLLPRLELIRRAGMDWSSVDYFVVNSTKSKFQRDTLALLGIDQSKIIESSATGYLRARELIVPSVPLGGGCFWPWMNDFLRNTFISKNKSDVKISGRRIYITRERAGYRRVFNEAEVVEFLRRRGFEIVAFEAMTVVEQATTMAACDVVVAPHGGGLSNLVFCSPGTKVIEIFSPELVAAYFWKICNQLKLDYYYVLGKGDPATLAPDYPQSWSARTDIEVDLKTLEQTLDLAKVV